MNQSKRNSTQQNLWDAVEKESAKAYHAFTTYRDLQVDERSLTTVSQRLGKHKSLCARWSAQFRWVERAQAWDGYQDELKRKSRAIEREKIYDRQLQHYRIALKAIMAPITALAKRAQTKAEPFAGVSDSELARIAIPATRSLRRIHEDERMLAGDPAEAQAPPIQIKAAEFTFVESACECGHRWGLHETGAEIGSEKMPCATPRCKCAQFIEASTSS